MKWQRRMCGSLQVISYQVNLHTDPLCLVSSYTAHLYRAHFILPLYVLFHGSVAESEGMITCELQAMTHSGKQTTLYTSFLLSTRI